MEKVISLTDREIEAVGEAYANYVYTANETGAASFYKNRAAVKEYICGYVRAMIKNGTLWTTGPRREAFIEYHRSDRSYTPACIAVLLKTFWKTLGPKGIRQLIRADKAAGESFADQMKRTKKPYLFVSLVAVTEPYQKQGYMRKVLEAAFEEGARQNLPVLLDTDDRAKCDRYVHLGMTNVRTRKLMDHCYFYDLVKEPR